MGHGGVRVAALGDLHHGHREALDLIGDLDGERVRAYGFRGAGDLAGTTAAAAAVTGSGGLVMDVNRGRHAIASPAIPLALHIEQPPSLEGPPQRDLIGVLQVSPHRQPLASRVTLSPSVLTIRAR